MFSASKAIVRFSKGVYDAEKSSVPCPRSMSGA
jgi:hypothetical protein